MIFPETLVEDDTREKILFPALDLIYHGGIYVELGTFLGGNLARCIDHINSECIEFYAIDNWLFQNISDTSNISGSYLQAFLDGMGDRKFKHIVSDSTKASEQFKDGCIDILFIDDDHNYPKVRANIKAWLPKVKSGGLICGHDYPDSGVKSAVNHELGNVNDNGHSWYKRL